MNQTVEELFDEDNEIQKSELVDDDAEHNEKGYLFAKKSTEARMFSLTQMQELWHLYFKRSTARKRIAANEESIGKLQ